MPPFVVDIYNIRARLLPAAISIAPAVPVAAMLISWLTFSLPKVIVSIIVAALFLAAADIARRRGKHFERQMFAATGGKPIMTLLRETDTTLDPRTKKRYRQFLAQQLGERPPTARQELSDPDKADGFYDRCGIWLREHTRDKAQFRVLFEENITYGFRRNLYGLRWPALALNACVSVPCILGLLLDSTLVQQNTGSAMAAVLMISIIHAAYFIFGVTRSSVQEASNQYARQLVVSCEVLIK